MYNILHINVYQYIKNTFHILHICQGNIRLRLPLLVLLVLPQLLSLRSDFHCTQGVLEKKYPLEIKTSNRGTLVLYNNKPLHTWNINKRFQPSSALNIKCCEYKRFHFQLSGILEIRSDSVCVSIGIPAPVIRREQTKT